MSHDPSRREVLGMLALGGLAAALPAPLRALPDPDRERLAAWSARLAARGQALRAATPGAAAVEVGKLAAGTPYEAHTLEAYLADGGAPVDPEPLALSLTRFDCVTLVESCLAVARVTRASREPAWGAFGRAVEAMRYRDGVRGDYASRLHYFSEWISDGARRGLVRDIGAELGGQPDTRPLRFMTSHRSSYPGLATDAVFARVAATERALDGSRRWVVPTSAIAGIAGRIESGDVLAFATRIPGLDVSHAAFAFRDEHGVLRVLHAPLSGGVVEVTRATLPEYVAAIRNSTGILIARPQWG